MSEEDSFESVVMEMAAIRSKDELLQFLKELLSPCEVRDIALRWTLLKRLAAGESQRKIASDLRISLCKITRGSRILKQNGIVSMRLCRKGKKESKKK